MSMRQVVLKTARIGYRSKPGEIVIDTTVKSAKGIGMDFAPTWPMVMASKRGAITWEEYSRQYRDLLRNRYKASNTAFETAVKARDIVLTCYCRKGSNCHRHLLKDILKQVARSFQIEPIDGGEVS